jgi:hypothetical protein
MRDQIIPPRFTRDEWNEMSHASRIKELHAYTKNFTLNATQLRDVLDEINYYVSIRNQIKVLIT